MTRGLAMEPQKFFSSTNVWNVAVLQAHNFFDSPCILPLIQHYALLIQILLFKKRVITIIAPLFKKIIDRDQIFSVYAYLVAVDFVVWTNE